MNVTDAISAFQVRSGPDSFTWTHNDILEKERRMTLAAQIEGTLPERIFEAGQQRGTSGVTAVGRSVDVLV